MQKADNKKGSNIFEKVIYVLKYIFSHWDRPPKGNFLSFREFAAYCVGGMGVFGVSVIPTYLSLAAGMYIAVALGVDIWDMTIIGLATSVFSLLRSPLLSVIIDNTNSRFGKFRPWLIWLPIPIMLSMLALVFIPYALIDNYVVMLVAFTIIFNIMQFFITLYSNAYNNLVLVISPSHKERTNLMSIGSVIYSLGPSIVTILFPLLANLLYSTKNEAGEVVMAGINDIRSMQVILPIMAAMCLALALLTAFGVKERFVQKRATVNKVKFVEGIKSASRNKYFWINTISTILGVFRMAATAYVVWIATYYYKDAPWAQSILVTLAGSACVPGMILAPMLINKFGKKKVVIAINTLCAIFTVPVVLAASVPTAVTPYVMYVFILLITLFNGATVVIQPALSAMINDYQQYKTGQRIEGFMGQLSFVLLTVVGLGTAFINPAIYEAFGFNGKNTEILYQTDKVTSPIIMWTSLIAIPSGILSIIPFLFWDLTEKRHSRIMEILAVRANVGDGKITEEQGLELEVRIESGEENVTEGLFDEIFEEEVTEKEETFTLMEFIKIEEMRAAERREMKNRSTPEGWKKFLEEEKIRKHKEKQIRKQEVVAARKRDKELEREIWEQTKANSQKEKEAKKTARAELRAEQERQKAEREKLKSSLSKEEWKNHLARERDEKSRQKQERKEALEEKRHVEKEQEKAFLEREKLNSAKEIAAEKQAKAEKKALKASMSKQEWKEYCKKSKAKKEAVKEECKTTSETVRNMDNESGE